MDPVSAQPVALLEVLDALVASIDQVAEALNHADPSEARLISIREAANQVTLALEMLTEPVPLAEWALLVEEASRGGPDLLAPTPTPGEAERAARFAVHVGALVTRLDRAAEGLAPLPERWSQLLVSPELLRLAADRGTAPTPDQLLAAALRPPTDLAAAERARAWAPLADLQQAQRQVAEMGESTRLLGQVFELLAQRGAGDA